ncbi:MAG: HEAT repeat domain-containing protein [Planctomycetes bacterium]|nr:HEAT repeat domain-containing protein [Planctomycetota bacterium]
MHSLRLLACLFLAMCSGCAVFSSSEADEAEAARPIQLQADEPIGKFLADADMIIARWNLVTLKAATPEQQREARLLRQVLFDRTSKRCADLVRELETGPPVNRVRAAAALGFSGAVQAQSPLLNALGDSHPDVVNNSLMALALLGRADTPLDAICKLSEFDPDAATRSQAAFAMRSIVNAGGSGDCARGAARRGLIDSEAFVRSQCALTLGLLADRDSLPALADLMFDKSVHVASAAIQAMLLLADKEKDERGRVARALLAAHQRSKGTIAELTMDGLVSISEVNYGSDMRLWTEWAERMP